MGAKRQIYCAVNILLLAWWILTLADPKKYAISLGLSVVMLVLTAFNIAWCVSWDDEGV